MRAEGKDVHDKSSLHFAIKALGEKIARYSSDEASCFIMNSGILDRNIKGDKSLRALIEDLDHHVIGHQAWEGYDGTLPRNILAVYKSLEGVDYKKAREEQFFNRLKDINFDDFLPIEVGNGLGILAKIDIDSDVKKAFDDIKDRSLELKISDSPVSKGHPSTTKKTNILEYKKFF